MLRARFSLKRTAGKLMHFLNGTGIPSFCRSTRNVSCCPTASMMVFSTPCFARPKLILARWREIACAALFGLAVVPGSLFAEGIQVRIAELEADSDGYRLSAEFDINFTRTLEDALNKGVALYFVTEFELVRPRWYWFDQRVVELRQQFKLSYNALTRQYRLSVGTLFQNYATLDEAVNVMSQLHNRLVADKDALQKGQTYTAALRMKLDVSQLPKPFQINALASKDWTLSSDWYRWEVTP